MNNKHTGKTKKVFDQKTFPKKGTEPQKAGDGTRHSRAKSKDIKQETPDIISTLFNTIPAETTKYLADFGTIVQDVLPLSGKQRKDLPHTIKDLSRQLTDERSRRRAGYMNETAQLSAYIRYFMWWNLVRLTHVFAGLAAFDPQDDSVLLDIGSGPLTVPVALWLARPDLRERRLTWYCLDQSQTALSAGENIFLALAARTGGEPWKVVRVKGSFGTEIRKKADYITCANMFNELYWDSRETPEALVKKYSQGLFAYAADSARIFIAEPGIPQGGRFISLMRDALIRKDYHIAAPCPHEGICPMPGKRGGKWCHFTFPAEGAPKALRKLSDEAGLSKDRAVLSLLFAVKGNGEISTPIEKVAETNTKKALSVRIMSDLIFLGVGKPGSATDGTRGAGRYGCSAVGLTLVGGIGRAGYTADALKSGDVIAVPMPDKNAPVDGKSRAVIVQPVGDMQENHETGKPVSKELPRSSQPRSSGKYRK